MPYISSRERRDVLQNATRAETRESTFGEVYSASAGDVVDEDLSVSMFLNFEGQSRRREIVQEKIASGEISREVALKYEGDTRIMGRSVKNTVNFDYGGLAEELDDPDILKDAQIEEQRAKILGDRRRQRAEVVARGDQPVAAFLGTLSAFALDPLNFVTAGWGGTLSASKAVGAAAGAIKAAKTAAISNVATEAMIQPLVFAHKQDIDSPYTFGDALENVAFAALGGALLGGATGSIKGYINKITNDLDKMAEQKLFQTPDEIHANTTLKRYGLELEGADEVLPARVLSHDEVISLSKEKLKPLASKKIARDDQAVFQKKIAQVEADIKRLGKKEPALRNQLNKQLATAKTELKAAERAQAKEPTKESLEKTKADLVEAKNKITDAKPSAKRIKEKAKELRKETRSLSAQQSQKRAKKAVEKELKAENAKKIEPIDRKLQTVDKDIKKFDEEVEVLGARAELKRIEEGHIPDDARKIFEDQINGEAQYLKTLDQKRKQLNQPSRLASHYADPGSKTKPVMRVKPGEDLRGSTKLKEIIENITDSETYNKTMNDFAKLDEAKVFIDGEFVDAKKLISNIDKEVEGIDAVTRCLTNG